MAFFPIPNTVRIDIHYNQAGQNTENVLYVTNPDGFGGSELDDLRNKFIDWIDATWTPVLPNTTSVTGFIMTDYTSDTGDVLVYTPVAPIAGDQNAGLPNNVTLSVAKDIQQRFRGGHGRLYVPGIPGDKATQTLVDSTFANLLRAALENLRTSIIGIPDTNWFLSLPRFTYVGGVPTAVEVFPIIQFKLVDYRIDSQRRRLAGRGL